ASSSLSPCSRKRSISNCRWAAISEVKSCNLRLRPNTASRPFTSKKLRGCKRKGLFYGLAAALGRHITREYQHVRVRCQPENAWLYRTAQSDARRRQRDGWLSSRLEQAVRSKGYEGSDTERGAEQAPGKHVTEEMHTKTDTRNADADGKKIKRRLQGRIEITDHERDGECCHGVTGREGELVRGKNLRPAMRFELARTLAMTDTLQRLEQENSDDGRG